MPLKTEKNSRYILAQEIRNKIFGVQEIILEKLHKKWIELQKNRKKNIQTHLQNSQNILIDIDIEIYFGNLPQ